MAASTIPIDWSRCSVLESNPDTQGGAWVFRGTRVPVTAILRNIGEVSVPELAEEFPTVRPEQITELLDFVARSVTASAGPAETHSRPTGARRNTVESRRESRRLSR